MTSDQLYSVFKTSFDRPLNGEEVQLLKNLQEEYPYFALARILQCKSLDVQQAVKEQIAYIPRRKLLRDFLNGKLYFAEIEKDASMENDQGRKPFHVLFPPHPFDQFSILEGLGKPDPSFAVDEALSIQYEGNNSRKIPFLQHMICEKVSRYKHVFIEIREQFASRYQQNSGKVEKAVKADQLVNEFLDRLPEIRPPKIAPLVQETAQIEHEAARKSVLYDEEGFVSETLAKLHLKQNNIGEAIRIYEILCLRFPEKSGYFEAQLEKLKE